MVGINNVTIIGNIGKISDVMTTTNGSRFINMTIATTETYYSVNKEKKSNTQWHNVIFWNNMTELNKIISKGDLLYIEGRLNYRTKADNQIFTEIVAKNYRILNRKNYSSSDKEFEIETDYPIGTIEIEDIDSLNINVFE
jgi:single-strand DNA-binding protein